MKYAGLGAIEASIFPVKPGPKIHYNLGFRNVGFREKIGKMNDIW